jgi:uncharacterized protein (TIGR02246 family)
VSQAGTTTLDDSKAVIERYVAAVVDGDEQTMRESFAVDATWVMEGDLPISGTWHGRDAIMAGFLAQALRCYEPGSVSIEVTNMIAEREQVAVEWITRARSSAGDVYENHLIGVFTVRNGKIQSGREYLDTRYAARVLFAEPARGV